MQCGRHAHVSPDAQSDSKSQRNVQHRRHLYDISVTETSYVQHTDQQTDVYTHLLIPLLEFCP